MSRCPALLLLGLLAACSDAPPSVVPGYVEGEFLRLSSPQAGRLAALYVERGREVSAGMLLFELEADKASAALVERGAELAAQSAQAADLAKGRRPDELAVIQAEESAVEASLRLVELQLKREKTLSHGGYVSQARVDELEARRQQLAAERARLTAQEQVARLAARDDQRRAAAASIVAAQARLQQARLGLLDTQVAAPGPMRVDDTLYHVGEWVPAGSPVVVLLPPGAIKVRFYVDHRTLPRLKLGQEVQLLPDGQPALKAKLRFIAHQAEFTPPVIYSREQRQRLVYLVEATPAPTDATRLHPGQALDVKLP